MQKRKVKGSLPLFYAFVFDKRSHNKDIHIPVILLPSPIKFQHLNHGKNLGYP